MNLFTHVLIVFCIKAAQELPLVLLPMEKATDMNTCLCHAGKSITHALNKLFFTEISVHPIWLEFVGICARQNNCLNAHTFQTASVQLLILNLNFR